MKNKPPIHYSRIKMVCRSVNGCFVCVWVKVPTTPTPALAVLRHLLAAYEARLKEEQAGQ